MMRLEKKTETLKKWSKTELISGEGKQWKVGCHSGPVSRGNRLISTTGSKANVAGDEHPQLRTATVCVPTLPYHIFFRS